MGQLSVLYVSTIPSVGFIMRLAIPVLKDMDGMSKIAVPVVSEPVPAVVGTNYRNIVVSPWNDCKKGRGTYPR